MRPITQQFCPLGPSTCSEAKLRVQASILLTGKCSPNGFADVAAMIL